MLYPINSSIPNLILLSIPPKYESFCHHVNQAVKMLSTKIVLPHAITALDLFFSVQTIKMKYFTKDAIRPSPLTIQRNFHQISFILKIAFLSFHPPSSLSSLTHSLGYHLWCVFVGFNYLAPPFLYLANSDSRNQREVGSSFRSISTS